MRRAVSARWRRTTLPRAAARLFLQTLLVAALLWPAILGPGSARADDEHQGLQAGWAVDDQGNVNFTSSFSLQNRYMHEAEASWIRLNFRLGACFTDWITPGCNGRTALQTYDEVVSIAHDHGFQVLGLIGHEAWRGEQAEWTANNAEHAGGNGDNPYLRRFADDAATVLAAHFDDRIRAWEVWNEPNAWTEQDERGRPRGGSFIFPSNFAWALTHAHAAIKAVQPDAIIISGGLFGHDLGDAALLFARTACPTGVNSGADYLCATYEMGLQHAGWQPGRFPFDHVGQHLYIDGGSLTSEEKLRFYLDDVRDAYLQYEGAETTKTTHITEFGWSTKDLSQELQAENLVLAFDTFRQVEYVARAYWFHAQDVPEAGLFYGLADSAGKQKRAFAAYQTATDYQAAVAREQGGAVAIGEQPAGQLTANARAAGPAAPRVYAAEPPRPAASPTPNPTAQPTPAAVTTDAIVLDADADPTSGGRP
ncbi:MAG: hypothetical protein IT306_22405 [Chloroflexi bacterium]|nr:hypothetical protein [Chloroflexota bacterium]